MNYDFMRSKIIHLAFDLKYYCLFRKQIKNKEYRKEQVAMQRAERGRKAEIAKDVNSGETA